MSAFFGKLLYDLTLDQHCRSFKDQGEGAADLLGALGHAQELEDVQFVGCRQIPTAAWQQLRGAKWPRLKKANFIECLARERNGWRCSGVFFSQCVLSTVRTVFILFGRFLPVQGQRQPFLWKLLYDLTLDQHCRCFYNQGEGAADLLEALGHSQELEMVNLGDFSKIPAAACQCVPSGAWPKLQYSSGIPDEEKRRLRSNEGGWPRCWDTISRNMQENILTSGNSLKNMLGLLHR